MNKSIITTAILLFTSSINAKSTISTSILVQPRYTLDQNSGFGQNSYNEFDLNKAKLNICVKNRDDLIKTSAMIALDFSEDYFSDILKRAWIKAKFGKSLKLTVGKQAPNFSVESSASAQNRILIYKGEISEHLNDDIGISNNNIRLEISGDIKEMIAYSFSVAQFHGLNTKGGGKKGFLNRLFSLPTLDISFKPANNFRLSYELAAPFVGSVLINNNLVGKRHIFQKIGVSVSKKSYSCLIEGVIAPDTTSTKELSFYLEDYKSSLSQAVQVTNSYKLGFTNNQSLQLSSRFEFLNGLEYNGERYLNRNFNYTLAGGLKYNLSKELSISAYIDNQFDSGFKQLDQMRLATQVSGFFKVKI